MARYGRLGGMVPQDPELTTKFGPPNPEDISSYGSRRGGVFDVTQYWDQDYDQDKSAQLAVYHKKYGSAMENKIAQAWQKMNAERFGFNRMPGKNYLAIAQDSYLQEMQSSEMNKMRNVRQRAKPNPMVYPSYPGDERE